MDTIRLKFRHTLPNTDYFNEEIRKQELNLTYVAGSRFAWTNNAWRKERQERGLYTPKYWIEEDYKKPEITHFCFEASLPKLLNSENITPLCDGQLEEVITAIINFLKEIGIYIFSTQIKNAVPTLIAIGKNINITKLCSCDLAIKSLKPFDYKSNAKHRVVDFSDYKDKGKELIFSIKKTETHKVYDKVKEILNQAHTNREREIAKLIRNNEYRIDGELVSEILRVELTFKTGRKIQQRLKLYLGNKPPTFENIFKQEIWDGLLREEMDKIFNHPLQKIIFLSLESQPFINSFLDEHYKHIQTKDTIKGILASLQEFGLAGTRKQYLDRYKSRQTWYNYLNRLKGLQKHLDGGALQKLSNVKIHSHILEQFGITTASQEELDLIFKNTLSKSIDNKLRNTKLRNTAQC